MDVKLPPNRPPLYFPLEVCTPSPPWPPRQLHGIPPAGFKVTGPRLLLSLRAHSQTPKTVFPWPALTCSEVRGRDGEQKHFFPIHRPVGEPRSFPSYPAQGPAYGGPGTPQIPVAAQDPIRKEPGFFVHYQKLPLRTRRLQPHNRRTKWDQAS